MDHEISFRTARPADIAVLLELMMISSWGGIRAAWERVKGPRESWRDRGLAELADADCEIGYSRFVLAEVEGRIAGMALLNRIADTGNLRPHLEPPEQVGAVALIKQASMSIFVRELAVTEWMRGRGLGRSFLDVAGEIAAGQGLDRVTLIVNDSNAAAHRLYTTSGFRTVASRPSIGHPAFADGSMLLLMEKAVASGR
jgi:ribosomal protein S18 acetylase RimI-like enzyme